MLDKYPQAVSISGHSHFSILDERSIYQDKFTALSIDLYDARVYEKARENLEKLVSDGICAQDQKPCFYIYRQIMEGRAQKMCIRDRSGGSASSIAL